MLNQYKKKYHESRLDIQYASHKTNAISNRNRTRDQCVGARISLLYHWYVTGYITDIISLILYIVYHVMVRGSG